LLTKWKLYEEKNHSGVAKPRKTTIQRQSKLQRTRIHKPIAVVIPLTITRSLSWTLPNQVIYLKGSLMKFFTLWPTSKIDFTQIVEHTSATARELTDLQFSQNTLSKLREFNTEFCTKHMPRGLYLWASENLILLKIGVLWAVFEWQAKGVRTVNCFPVWKGISKFLEFLAAVRTLLFFRQDGGPSGRFYLLSGHSRFRIFFS
jgi:hypothetical protein